MYRFWSRKQDGQKVSNHYNYTGWDITRVIYCSLEPKVTLLKLPQENIQNMRILYLAAKNSSELEGFAKGIAIRTAKKNS